MCKKNRIYKLDYKESAFFHCKASRTCIVFVMNKDNKDNKDNKEISKMELKDTILTIGYLKSEKMKRFYESCMKCSDLSRFSDVEQEEFIRDEKLADNFVP